MQVAEVIDRINLTLIGVNFLISRSDICIAPPLGDMRLSSCRTSFLQFYRTLPPDLSSFTSSFIVTYLQFYRNLPPVLS